MIELNLPVPIQNQADVPQYISLNANSYETLRQTLKADYSKLYNVIFHENGQQHGFLQFVYQDRLLKENDKQKIPDGAQIEIITALSGG